MEAIAAAYNPCVLVPHAASLIVVLRKLHDYRDNLHGRVQEIGRGVGGYIATEALDLKHRVEVFQMDDQTYYCQVRAQGLPGVIAVVKIAGDGAPQSLTLLIDSPRSTLAFTMLREVIAAGHPTGVHSVWNRPSRAPRTVLPSALATSLPCIAAG